MIRTPPLILGTGWIIACCSMVSFYKLCECPPLANVGPFWQLTVSRHCDLPEALESSSLGRGVHRGDSEHSLTG